MNETIHPNSAPYVSWPAPDYRMRKHDAPMFEDSEKATPAAEQLVENASPAD